MRISDWSSDVCSSDLHADRGTADAVDGSRGHVHDDPLTRTADGRSTRGLGEGGTWEPGVGVEPDRAVDEGAVGLMDHQPEAVRRIRNSCYAVIHAVPDRSEEHTSELQSLMPISYSVLCLKQKIK